MRSLLIVLLGTLCAGYPNRHRVINGMQNGGPMPYLVSIQVNGYHICGGFIYNENWVVTTASCVKDKAVSSLSASINDYKLTGPADPEEFKVSIYRVIINDGYNATTKFSDIALLELSQTLGLIPLKDSEDAGVILGPSCLQYDEVLPTYDYGFFSGWGLTEIGGPNVTTIHKGNVRLTASSNCAEVPNFTATTMICTNNTRPTGDSPITVPCTYDEGSPVFVYDPYPEPTAVGIFSYNDQCKEDSPSIFTRLSVFYGWLSRTAGYQPLNCYYPLLEK